MTTTNYGSEQRAGTGQFPRAQGQDKAESVKEQAKDVVTEAQEQAQSMLASRKEQAASELGNIAQAFRQTGDQLREQEKTAAASALNQVAGQVERFSNFLTNNEITDLLDEAENLARRNPELFLGGAFALGLLASRFLKASASQASQGMTEQNRGYREAQRWSPTRSTVQTYSPY